MNSILKLTDDFFNEMIEMFERFFHSDEIEEKNTSGLLIGINYENTMYELRGCIHDAENLNRYFTSHYSFENKKLLTDHTEIKPTRENIIFELTNMLQNAKEGDTCIFTYSGHGIQLYDRDGDEIDGADESIITLDLKFLVDDDFYKIIDKNIKENVNLILIMDCCNSASNVDLEYELQTNGDSLAVHDKKNSITRGNVVSISGASDDQYGYETVIDDKVQGLLTTTLINILNNNSLFENEKESNKKWQILLNELYRILYIPSEERSEILNTPIQKPHISSNRPINEIPFLL